MSIEGLNSLIQLESTRLEGAKSVTQNFQSVNSTVQQQGMQVASSKSSMAMNRIDAQYTKEVAQADVRMLERKLARERGSEALSKSIAAIAFIGNAVGNFGHMVNDLKGRQKLGETPEYLRAPSMDPNNPKPTIGITTDPASAANRIYASSEVRSDGSQTVYAYSTGADGVSTGGLPIAANISEYDKERILGDAYTQMKAQNGGNPLSFEQIREKRPDLAEKLVSTRGHGVSSDEAENLMQVMEGNLAPTTTSTMNRPQAQTQGTQHGAELGRVLAVTLPNSETDPPADAARLMLVYSSMTLDQQKDIVPSGTIAKDFFKTSKNQMTLTSNPEFMAKLNNPPTPMTFNSGVNLTNHDNEDVQINNNGLSFEINNMTPQNKKDIDPKYKNMTFAQIHKDSPANARLLVSSVVKEQFDTLDPAKQAEIMVAMGITNPNQFSASFSSLMEGDPAKVNEIVGKMGSNPRLQTLSASQVSTNATAASAANSLPALRDSLGKQGKLDNRGVGEKITDVAKPVMNFLVNTIKDSVPYFQAYLSAKNKADETQEQLLAAKEKLEAANRRLKSIEAQIDVFGGRGA